jgi:cobalamin biosynthesis Mg chelatase CobN
MADVRLFVRKLPLCNATDTTSASQTSVASTSTQTAAPTSVATQTPVGSTSVVPTQTTAPVSDASTTGATNTTQTTAPATDASITGATNTTQQTTTAANSASAQVSPTPTEPDSQIGAIVGGVVAALVLVAIVFGVFLFQRRRRGDNAITRSETGSVTAQSQSATSSPYGSTLAVLN